MDLDQLQSVRDRERQTDRLQQLRTSFYEDAGEFVADLRAERDEAAAAAEDPFDSPRVNRLTDRIRTAEQTLEAIYEKRVGKVVKAATFAAADLPAEADGMTTEEQDLFDTLVDEIEANRARVLGRLTADRTPDVDGSRGAPGESGNGPAAGDEVSAADLVGEASPPSEDEGSRDGETVPDDGDPSADDGETGPESEGTGPESEETGSEVEEPESGDADSGRAGSDRPVSRPPPDGTGSSTNDGPGPEPDDAETVEDGTDPTGGEADEPAPDVNRQLVRITDDVGPILGVDEREYDLSKDDVVTLPAENARPLVERGAAERLE